MTEDLGQPEQQPAGGEDEASEASRAGGMRRLLGRVRRGRPGSPEGTPSEEPIALPAEVDLQPARREPADPVDGEPAETAPTAEEPESVTEETETPSDLDPDIAGGDDANEGASEGSTAPNPALPHEGGGGQSEAPVAVAGEDDGAPDDEAPAEEEAYAEDEPEVEPEPRVRRRRAEISAHLVVLTGMATAVILAYLLIEPSPRWVLLLGAAGVVFGLDGTLRQTWRQPFAAGAETSPFLFVPALYMLAVPVVVEHNVPGELVILGGLVAGGGFGALAWGETASVRAQSEEYDLGRVLVTAGTYVAGFSVFSLTYVFEFSLGTAVLAVALASTMLAVEVLREGEIDPLETLGFAAVTGVVMAEARLLLYYVPLDTYLAGLTLLLAFYLVTGLLHSHITRAFSWPLSAEYGGIAAVGLALVVLARAAGLA